MDAELKQLVHERGLVKASLTRFKRFFSESRDSCSIRALQKRLEANLNLLESFNKCQEGIEKIVLGTDAENVHSIERDQFENTYFELIAEVEEFVQSRTRPSALPGAASDITENSDPSTTRVDFKLPLIQLPSFDGNYSDWIRFRDTFVALIHTNTSISDIQKFHYLNSTLKGSAARVVKSFGTSDVNYKLAWETLTARYEDPMALRRHHMDALLNLTPVQKHGQGALQEFIDDANNHISALKALGEPVHSWDFILVSILSKKLDGITSREWEREMSRSSEKESYKGFTRFLEERARYLGSIARTQVPTDRVERRPQQTYGQRFGRPTAQVATEQTRCPVCQGGHPIYRCVAFKRLNIQEKREIVQRGNRCYNCLEAGHGVANCSRRGCQRCDRKHHTLLHRENTQPEKQAIEQQPSGANSVTSDSEPASCVANVASKCRDYTILSTAIIHVRDKTGKTWDCRALLDSGSQVNFITRQFCKKIGMSGTITSTQVMGLGKNANTIRERTNVQVGSQHNSFRANVECLIMDEITPDMPNIPLQQARIPIPSNISLADPHFDKCARIDMLIGAGLFWRLLCIGQHRAGSGLIWQKTQFGWVLGGQLTWPNNKGREAARCHVATDKGLHDQLERFWHIEEVASNKPCAEDACEQYFQATTQRDDSGRYIVRIPFKDNTNHLGTSRDQAERRLRSLEKRLAKHSGLEVEYRKFMEEYKSLGHMTKISECISDIECAFYLPHHAVTKETSTTTKVRVVFDGSAKSSSGLSLNDTQLVGPTVQNDLFSILIKFRCHRYVASADIEKMYRQILIHPEDRKFQQILWRSNSVLPIEAFQLNTVTYGTASAPFLATRVLKQIGLDCAESNPEASDIILNDFYVDYLLTGADTIAELVTRKGEITDILARAGLHLRKWASNCRAILAESSRECHEERVIAEKDQKTLGLLWSATEDHLYYSANSAKHTRITKRIILSEIAQIFDPLGLIGPVIVRAKILMQELWQLKLGWDESVPHNLYTLWSQFRSEIENIKSVRIPRQVVVVRHTCELHGFSDALEQAYGACVYLRSVTASGSWESRLLCAKSRVAPLKSLSLPRLELCGALLLARLIQRVRTALNFRVITETYWSDSMITLAWIQGSPSKWKTFVANRVAEIQEITSAENWFHVMSEDNPADLLSRGVNPVSLAGNSLWWSGPEWLCKDSAQWNKTKGSTIDVPEVKKARAMAFIAARDYSFHERFSNWSRLLRVIGYCLRFIQLARKIKSPLRVAEGTSLTTKELRDSEHRVIQIVQEEAFSEELASLRGQKPVKPSSPLVCLNPFLDKNGLIRVGGRLKNSQLEYDNKHPIILPSSHRITDLVINAEHLRLLHGGCQLVMASLRKRYWVISCRRNVRRILGKCVRCFRVRPRTLDYIMGDLPAARVTPARPFSTCGIDYAGPFITKERTRSKVTVKSYLCIFVCFATRAIHVEVAIDLSSDAFLNCLRRFTSRRGRPRCIVSDNGTNFIGARNELRELQAFTNNKDYKRRVLEHLNNERIEWHLNPPHAPHFGGLWESAVRAVKYHLRRVIGEQRLTFEELCTIVTQVEACLNSRPLTPISTDPSDLESLTPGHFLVGGALSSLPEHDLRDVNTHRLGRFQLIQQMFQHFWDRWHKEYLHQLQQRSKWRTTTPSVWTIDTMVVIKDDNLPPLRWRLGRIVDLHRGADGVIRVVSVKTAEGIVKRPVVKLCILPIKDDVDLS